MWVSEEAKQLLFVGLPLGIVWALSYFFLFLVASIFGRLGTDVLAAYQIVAQWLSAFFVISASLATVLKMRMGFALGQKNKAGVIRASQVAFGINIIFLLILAPIMVHYARYLIWFDMNLNDPLNASVIHYAESFFAAAFVYLFFYSLNYLLSNALIGLKDVFYILSVCCICWLGLGVPLVFWAAHFYPATPTHLIDAMTLSECFGVLFLARRYVLKLKTLSQ